MPAATMSFSKVHAAVYLAEDGHDLKQPSQQSHLHSASCTLVTHISCPCLNLGRGSRGWRSVALRTEACLDSRCAVR